MKYCHSSCIVPPTNLPKMFAFEPAVRDDTKLLVQFQLNRIALIFTPEKSLRGEWGGWAKNANNIWQSYTLSPHDRRQLEAKKRIAVPPFQYFWRFRGKNTGFLSNVPILATPYFISKMILKCVSMGYAFPYKHLFGNNAFSNKSEYVIWNGGSPLWKRQKNSRLSPIKQDVQCQTSSWPFCVFSCHFSMPFE